MIQILTNWCKISAKWSLFCPKPKGSQLCWGVSDVGLGTSSQHLAQHSHKEPWAVVYMGAYYGVGSTEPPQCRAHHIKTSTNVELSRNIRTEKGQFSIKPWMEKTWLVVATQHVQHVGMHKVELCNCFCIMWIFLSELIHKHLWPSWEIDPYIWYNFKFVAFKSLFTEHFAWYKMKYGWI